MGTPIIYYLKGVKLTGRKLSLKTLTESDIFYLINKWYIFLNLLDIFSLIYLIYLRHIPCW